jgi:RNA polymerase sigma factor (TIGR02999 family)
MANVTHLLDAAAAGDSKATAEVLLLVYDELRRLAAAQMAREKPGQTLDATALVHEAYLRLVGDQHFDNRRHFFAAATEAMRRILVENVRRKNRQKRGGGRKRIDLEGLSVAAPEKDERLLALDEALERLAAVEPQKAELVKLRSFAGLSLDAAADLLGISPSTADRWWAYARAWLRVEIEGEKPASSRCDPPEKGA